MTIIAFDLVAKRIGTISDGATPGTPATDLYLNVTSKLYPVIVEENVDGAGLPTRGAIYSISEQIDASGVLYSGTLRTVLLTGYAGPDAADATGDLISGTLRTVLLTGYAGPDAADATGDLLSGTLVNKLVTYSNWTPESCDASGAVIGGTLV